MAGDDGQRLELLYAVQRGSDFVKGLQAFDFGEDHTKAVFPQRIGRDQRAAVGLEQNHRMRIMPRGGVDLPVAADRRTLLPGCSTPVMAKRGHSCPVGA